MTFIVTWSLSTEQTLVTTQKLTSHTSTRISTIIPRLQKGTRKNNRQTYTTQHGSLGCLWSLQCCSGRRSHRQCICATKQFLCGMRLPLPVKCMHDGKQLLLNSGAAFTNRTNSSTSDMASKERRFAYSSYQNCAIPVESARCEKHGVEQEAYIHFFPPSTGPKATGIERTTNLESFVISTPAYLGYSQSRLVLDHHCGTTGADDILWKFENTRGRGNLTATRTLAKETLHARCAFIIHRD